MKISGFIDKHIKTLAISIWIAGFLFVLLYNIFNLNITNLFPPCEWLTKYGFICPACGGSRSLHYFLKGQIIESMKYNITFTLTYIILIVFWALFTYKVFKNKDYQKFTINYLTVFGIVFIVLIVINTILRNILPYPHIKV